MDKLRSALLALLLFTLLGTAACGSSGGLVRPTPTHVSAASAVTTATAAPTALSGEEAVGPSTEAEIPPTVRDEAAIDIMWRVIGRYGGIDEDAVIAAGVNGNLGLVPVLVETAALTLDTDLSLKIATALEMIVGESVGGDYVLAAPWYSWMSRQAPPQVELEGFDEWKGQRLGAIDPSFREFLYQDVPARIPIWSVQWGGVYRDGIPPLEFPINVPGSGADFLLPGEPVFGVTINGESRAYPHRIMGWHELANDVLGGEQITFVF